MTGSDYRIGIGAIADHYAKAIDYEGHRRNIEAFLDAIGSYRDYELDGVQAWKVVALIEAVYDSAERGEPVRVD